MNRFLKLVLGEVVQSCVKITHPMVGVEFDLRFKNFKRKFSCILCVYNSMNECSKSDWENYPKTAFEQRNIKIWIQI